MPFVYEPILEWQTRVLDLHPGPWYDTLRTSLHAADMIHAEGLGVSSQRTRVQFEALSYCWGPSALTQHLICNGREHPITATLHQALSHLRSRKDSRWLWIHALCIDQDNKVEKSTQVANMFLIYEKAKCVNVWLGAHGSHTCLLYTSPSPRDGLLSRMPSSA